MPPSMTEGLLSGDIRFFDSCVPAVRGGHWFLHISHKLDLPEAEEFACVQEFRVDAPRFTIDTSEIVTLFPPDGATGDFTNTLPYVVLRRPTLPWERALPGGADTMPWLALLVLSESELVEGTSPTRATAITVGEFLKPADNVLMPEILLDADTPASTGCSFIELSMDTFRKIMPRLDELPYLVHCRESSQADKAATETDRDGLYSVVVANRFPIPSVVGRTIVHLVSLEGLAGNLPPSASGTYKTARLLSLASWSFTCGGADKTFDGLLKALIPAQRGGMTADSERLRLRLPTPEALAAKQGAAEKEAMRRLGAGFVPLHYQTRSGERTFAWYRGPFVPEPTQPADSLPYFSGDMAVIYDREFATFDMSLAVAWETGRCAALADQSFGRELLDFRRRVNRMIDRLQEVVVREYFSPTAVDLAAVETRIQGEFAKLFARTDVREVIGQRTVTPEEALESPGPTAIHEANCRDAIERFMNRDDTQVAINAFIDKEVAPLIPWLTRLALLYPVPLSAMVPDERMLPDNALRVFYLDQNWIDALLDGAMSPGLDCSRQTKLQTLARPLIRGAVAKAYRTCRDEANVGPAPAMITGLLLRSPVVAGWPKMAVNAAANGGAPVAILRMDHLAPSLLLCLFDGVPDIIRFIEPQEGFRIGVDAEGMRLRSLAEGPDLGSAIAGKKLSMTGLLRDDGTGRVLDVSGLVGRLSKELDVVPAIRAADLAIQLMLPPAIVELCNFERMHD